MKRNYTYIWNEVETLAPNMGLLTTPAAGATQGLTASPIRWQQV